MLTTVLKLLQNYYYLETTSQLHPNYLTQPNGNYFGNNYFSHTTFLKTTEFSKNNYLI